MVRVTTALVLMAGLALQPAIAEEMRSEAVHFPAGQTGTTIKGQITGYDSVLYKLGAEAGQTLSVTLAPSNDATYFNVYAPGTGPGDAALAVSQNMPQINRFEGALPQSGEYTVSVYMMRSAARRDERSDYTLTLAVTGATGATVQGDFADGLQGGPDFWQVKTASSAGQVNLRDAPSTGAAVLRTVYDGQVLRNLGCRMAEGRRWCKVALPDGSLEAWTAGEFLIEGADPGVAAIEPVPEPETRSERVSFAAGTSGAAEAGTLAPGAAVNYLLNVQQGQFLAVRLEQGGPGARFNIFAPGGTMLFESAPGGDAYRGQLGQSGDHTVTVFNTGDQPVSYAMQISVE